MTDRWTEAQLREELCWVLSLEWAGGTWRLSTDALEITDGTSTIVTTPDLVDYPEIGRAHV